MKLSYLLYLQLQQLAVWSSEVYQRQTSIQDRHQAQPIHTRKVSDKTRQDKTRPEPAEAPSPRQQPGPTPESTHQTQLSAAG